MAGKVLGLDIGDDLLTAVAVRRRGKERKLAGFASLPRDATQPLAEQLAALLEQVPWQGYSCVAGIPLGRFSLRNLEVPFREDRKIGQILPFELEEQLLVPPEEQVVCFRTISATEKGSHLLVTGLEKAVLQEYLESMQEDNLDPDRMLPAILPLAWEVMRDQSPDRDCILVSAGLHSAAMAICRQGQVIFLRRLPYPEQMFTAVPFSFSDNQVLVKDREEAAGCISMLTGAVRRSMDFFIMEHEMELDPGAVILTGPLALAPDFRKQVQEALAMEGIGCDLLTTTGVKNEAEGAEAWQPAIYDQALALALSGFRKKTAFELRTGEFACRRKLSTTRQIALAAAAGILIFLAVLVYQWTDYRRLHHRYTLLGREMEEIFRATFPDVQRVVDPLLQMESKLREVRAPAAVATPLFNGEKRALEILADISSRIPPSLSLHVSRLVIDRESVQIKGTTDAFNNVDAIKTSLAKSSRYQEVKIVSATAGKNKGTIRFEIRLQLREAG